MLSKIIIPLLISCIIVGCNMNKDTDIISNVNTGSEQIGIITTEDGQKEAIVNNGEGREEMINSVKVMIENKEYMLSLEDNETTKAFLELLPNEWEMNELNGNEKYVYISDTLPTNSYNPRHIEAGDVMLFGNNCLVVFYQSFDTSYSYTKIGHIENLSDLEGENILIKFEK